MNDEFQKYYDQSEMVLKTDHATLYVLPDFYAAPPSLDGIEALYFTQYQQAYDYLKSSNTTSKVAVIKGKSLGHQPPKQQTPPWLVSGRVDSGWLTQSNPMPDQKNRSQTIGLASHTGRPESELEHLAKSIIGRKIIVQKKTKPTSIITNPKATAVATPSGRDESYPKCFWESQTNCVHNPLKDPPLVETSQSNRSRTGELEAGFQRSPNVENFSVGLSIDGTWIIPGMELGAAGLNLQVGGGVTGLYGFVPVLDSPGEGFAASVLSIGANLAKGSGSWTGPFLDDSVGVGPYGGSVFYSPDLAWRGLSANVGIGLPVEVSHKKTFYYQLLNARQVKFLFLPRFSASY